MLGHKFGINKFTNINKNSFMSLLIKNSPIILNRKSFHDVDHIYMRKLKEEMEEKQKNNLKNQQGKQVKQGQQGGAESSSFGKQAEKKSNNQDHSSGMKIHGNMKGMENLEEGTGPLKADDDILRKGTPKIKSDEEDGTFVFRGNLNFDHHGKVEKDVTEEPKIINK